MAEIFSPSFKVAKASLTLSIESTIEDEEERAESRFEFMGISFGHQTSDIQDKIFKVQEQIIMEVQLPNIGMDYIRLQKRLHKVE